MNTNLKINSENVVYWFNALRNLSADQRDRALDAFWSGQIDSKSWLVNVLNDHVNTSGNVYIFGGWIGVLGNLLLQSSTWNVKQVISIDVDPWCESVANTLNYPYTKNICQFKAVTDDMANYNYDWDVWPDIVINTSTEHVDQGTYDKWWDKIPSNTLILLQGNDFFDCPEHVRCSASLTDFKRINHVTNPLWSGVLKHDLYNRFMAITIK